MEITSLALNNFRNFSKIKFNFNNLSIILGPNASGKTNVLESFWLLSHAKSFKAEEEAEMIRHQMDSASVLGEGTAGEDSFKSAVTIVKNHETGRVQKRYFLNDISKKAKDFIEYLPMVLFAPFHLELISSAPSLRRSYLDNVLIQTDINYHRAVSQYEKLLRARNKLLERIAQKSAKKEQLEFWDKNLVKLGRFITHRREEFLSYCNNFKKQIGNFWLKYLPNIISLERLDQSFDQDLRNLSTTVGPHRDDFIFFLNKKDLPKFGSRGEGRMAILAIKLAELSFIKGKSNKKPILLLDDIFSELDKEHRMEIEKIVSNQQTIITTTEPDSVPKKIFKKSKVIEL